MARGRKEERMEEEVVRPYNEQMDYEGSDNEQSQKNVIPDEMEVQIPLIRSEGTTSRRKKAVKSILKNKPKKKALVARRINKMVSTVETLINRIEEEQVVNMVTERRSTLEPTLNLDDLRNKLNQTRQEKGKHRPTRESTKERARENGRHERIREDGRQEMTQTSHHVSTSRAPNIRSRHNDSRREERFSIRYGREEESRSNSTKHSALSKSEREELHQLRQEREEMEKQEKLKSNRLEKRRNCYKKSDKLYEKN